MKLLPRPATPMPAGLARALQTLQALLGRWLPQPPPALVPIPVRADRRPRNTAGPSRHRRV